LSISPSASRVVRCRSSNATITSSARVTMFSRYGSRLPPSSPTCRTARSKLNTFTASGSSVPAICASVSAVSRWTFDGGRMSPAAVCPRTRAAVFRMKSLSTTAPGS
jgi:hypothetical protein